MKKKILIGIGIIICVVGIIIILGFTKRTENITENVPETTDNSTYKLRSYTTSETFYITAPSGYNYDENQTGIMDSKAVFTKANKINTSLTYKFASEKMDEYIESIKKVNYEKRRDSDYYKDFTWQDTNTLTVNNNEIKYVKITYNNGSKYYNEIYSIASVQGWIISCEIKQYGDSNDFDSDSKLIKEAWEISFNEED